MVTPTAAALTAAAPRRVDPPDTSLDVFPAAAYGARWGQRSAAMIANMSKLAMVVLMQEDGECWTRCCTAQGRETPALGHLTVVLFWLWINE